MRTFVTCLLVFVGGCYGLDLPGHHATGSGSDGTDNAEPSCTATLCDLQRAQCSNPTPHNPCDDCFDQCSTIDDPVIVQECYANCVDCHASSGPVDDVCGRALDACRQTDVNAICAGDVTQPGSEGEACGDDASELYCQCLARRDGDCFGALERAAPACWTCIQNPATDMDGCVQKACSSESAALVACSTANPCWSNGGCRTCDQQYQALIDCAEHAAGLPGDPYGCYAEAHLCMSKPFCTADGHARR